MSDWNNPHPYQDDRTHVRAVSGGTVRHPHSTVTQAQCCVCLKYTATLLHGGLCRACAHEQLKLAEFALRRCRCP